MTDDEITKALDDIHEMKKSINGILRIMRPILLDRIFIPFCWMSAAFFSGVFIWLQTIIDAYGKFGAAPFELRTGWIGFSTMGTFLLWLYKMMIVRRSVARRNRTMTILNLFTRPEFRNAYMLLLYGIATIGAGIAVAAVRGGNPLIALPLAFLAASFFIALLASLFMVREFFALSAASLVYSVATILLMDGEGFFWLAGYIGGLCSAYALIIQTAKGNR